MAWNWNCTSGPTEPPTDVLLDVVTESGTKRQLVWSNNLWWMPNKSMYVYFVPKYWREAEETN